MRVVLVVFRDQFTVSCAIGDFGSKSNDKIFSEADVWCVICDKTFTHPQSVILVTVEQIL